MIVGGKGHNNAPPLPLVCRTKDRGGKTPERNGAPSLVRATSKEDRNLKRHDYRKKVARTKLGAPLNRQSTSLLR